MKLKVSHDYDDIINEEYKMSQSRKPMSLYARSAQFAPFSALTGYEDIVNETAREVGMRIDIDEGLKGILNNKIQNIERDINEKHKYVFTYFVPDMIKNGGKYISVVGIVKKIDRNYKYIALEDGTQIPINEVLDITESNF